MASRLDRKANKRFDWVPLLDGMCGPVALDCKGCCDDPEFPDGTIRGCTYDEFGAVESSAPSPYPLILVPPADVPQSGEAALQAQDSFTIVRMSGFVELCPGFCNAADQTALCNSDPANCPSYNAFAEQFDNYHLRAGLSKDRWELDDVTDPNNPVYATIVRNPLETQEWSDAQFIRTWERVKGRKDIVRHVSYLGSSQLGCCGNTSAAGAGAPANTLSNGSGTVNIPAISTDCEPCFPEVEQAGFRDFGADIRQYGCIRLSLNSKRRLVLRENEGLTMWLNWTSFTPGDAPSDNWRRNIGWWVRPFLKVLRETA